jgi:hypothetical protein
LDTTGEKIPGQVNVVGKICQQENRFRFIQEGIARTREDIIRVNENIYKACIYDILKDRKCPRDKTPTLNHSKTQIVRLHCKRLQSITIDTYEATLFQGERPSLLHLLPMRKRCVSRVVTNIIARECVIQTATMGIVHTFVRFVQANMNLFRWMMFVLLEWINLGTGIYRRNGGASYH